MLFTISRKQKKYQVIKLELLPGDYQRANRPSVLASCDKFINNWKIFLQYKHTHHTKTQARKIGRKIQEAKLSLG